MFHHSIDELHVFQRQQRQTYGNLNLTMGGREMHEISQRPRDHKMRQAAKIRITGAALGLGGIGLRPSWTISPRRCSLRSSTMVRSLPNIGRAAICGPHMILLIAVVHTLHCTILSRHLSRLTRSSRKCSNLIQIEG